MRTLLFGALAVIAILVNPNAGLAQAPPLGATSGFALFTAAGAFNAAGASTVVTGDAGTNVGAFNAFPPGVLVGAVHVADPATASAATDVDGAYGFIGGLTCGSVIATTLGNNQVLAPDIYCLGAASTLNGNLTLDGQSNPNAIFIFKINGALSTGTFASVTLINSASICNVYWQVNGAFSLGNNSVFRGTLIVNGAINLLNGATLLGRGLTRAGAISLQNNIVNLGSQPTPSTISAGGTTTFCAGGSVILSGNNSGTWNNGSTTASITATNSGNYFVTNTGACTSVTSNHIIVTVNLLPSASTGSNASICTGGNVTLGASPISGHTYLWTPATGLSSATIANPVASPVVTTTYTLTETITATTCQNSNSVTVTVGSIASTLSAAGPTTFCTGGSVVLSGNNGGTWSTGATTPTLTVSASGDYFVTNSDACGTITSNHIVVTVNPLPNANAGADQTIDACVNTTLTASSATTGVTYSWGASGGGHIVSGTNTASVTVDQPGTYTVTVTKTSTGCFATDVALVTPSSSASCAVCNGNVITLTSNVTVNFNTTIPTYTGPASLLPFFSYLKVGTVPSLWRAIFDMGAYRLSVPAGITMTTSLVNGSAPGIIIMGTCDLNVETGGHIILNSNNKNSGDILLIFDRNITVNGEVRNQVSGTQGLPGSITARSLCGAINVGQTGLIQDLGIDAGGNLITLQTCGTDCLFNGSNIIISGLVKSFAHAHSGNLAFNRPNIKVVSLSGSITINANTAEPLFDEFSMSGTLYDLYGGLLSWVRDNANPGKVEVQALHDIIVNGHGTDPTGAVRTSFGAIAAVATASEAPGGLVDVRSISGRIIANNRSFDVSGRNRLTTNYAHILLQSAGDIMLTRSGANNTYNPVLDASAPGVGDRGGINEIRSYSGGISVGTGAVINAHVTAGVGSVQGMNLLTTCTGISNSGTFTPEDAIPADNSGVCDPASPDELYNQCLSFDLQQLFLSPDENTNETEVAGTMLFQNTPNPFAFSTTITYALPEASAVKLVVYDLYGRVVAVLADEVQTQGYHSLVFNTGLLSSGIYSYQLLTGTGTESMKMMISK